MKANVGSIDRIVRIVAGVLLLGYAVFGGAALGTTVVTGIIGAILVVTALIRVCPIYSVCGISTAPKLQRDQKS